MDTKQMQALVTFRHDQDEAACLKWWRDQTVAAKADLWLYMNNDFRDPRAEAMSRLALLKFEELALAEDK